MNIDRQREAPEASTWYSIKAAADEGGPTRIDLYDEIDPLWGVSAAAFVSELRAVESDAIDLHINSPGGSVYDGIAIMNALRQHDATVTVTVDGLAASAAGFIAIGAADELIMAENSELMLHEAWGISIGNAADMRAAATDLDRVSANIASIYAGRAGGTVDEWREVMQTETWYSADEAVTAGLADRVLKAPKTRGRKPAAKASASRWDLSRFIHAGRSNAPAPRLLNTLPLNVSSASPEVTPRKEGSMPTLNEGLRERFGLSEDADDAAVLAAVDAALTKTPEPTPSALAAQAKAHGLVVVDSAAYADVLAKADKGVQALEQLQAAQRNTELDRHVKRGAIAASRRAHFADMLIADPTGTTELLNRMPDGLMVPTAEIGHGGEPDIDIEQAELAGVYAKITGTDVTA